MARMRGSQPILLISFHVGTFVESEELGAAADRDASASASVQRCANVDVAKLSRTCRGITKMVSPALIDSFAIIPRPMPGMGWIRHRESKAPPDWRNQRRKLA